MGYQWPLSDATHSPSHTNVTATDRSCKLFHNQSIPDIFESMDWVYPD